MGACGLASSLFAQACSDLPENYLEVSKVIDDSQPWHILQGWHITDTWYPVPDMDERCKV